ncbi:hypothetical protein E2C01_040855 [Portunus trituberculatus]|uniref:Uncharacterized protein n=1 Tax=Portunus trituberculatus TaxID=210409 RepID=A0A5B7FHQ7_PORTR|nr:hypothetical protein [Portunus trituberculatus]
MPTAHLILPTACLSSSRDVTAKVFTPCHPLAATRSFSAVAKIAANVLRHYDRSSPDQYRLTTLLCFLLTTCSTHGGNPITYCRE